MKDVYEVVAVPVCSLLYHPVHNNLHALLLRRDPTSSEKCHRPESPPGKHTTGMSTFFR